MEIVDAAQRLADDVLFPRALEVDSADTLPRENLDALADAGLYGLGGPRLDVDFATVCAVHEALSSGCLTTAFVWAQHIGGVRAAAASENAAIREWVEPLSSGERRAGLAHGGALPGPPRLRARRADGGWIFAGESPWVSGWGRVDVLQTAGRTDDDGLVWAFVDPGDVRAERLELVALNATATVRAVFDDVFVPDERVVSTSPLGLPPQVEAYVLRIHASFGLGVAARCLRMLGESPLDAELAAVRAQLDAVDPETIAPARAWASEVALRASAALAASVGSRSILRSEHAQRLVREAFFVSVYAGRPPVRAALLERLTAA